MIESGLFTWLLALGTLCLRAGAEPYSFELTGSCSNNIEIDDTYAPVNTTSDGRWFYEGQANGLFIYFDPDCDGASGFVSAADAWLIDSDEPSRTAFSDLDGDGVCLNSGDGFKARIADSGTEPPTGTQSWRIWCGTVTGVANTDLTVVLIGAPTLSPSFSPQPTLTPTSCHNFDSGATDIYGYSCDYQYAMTTWCDGSFDDTDFTWSAMCCLCGGGSSTFSPTTLTPLPTTSPTVCFDSDNGATDSYGDSCATYLWSWCGSGDTVDFSSNVMCCLCGGGTGPDQPTPVPTVSAPPSLTPIPTAAATACFDLDNGAQDPTGYACHNYAEEWCGFSDDSDFSSNAMCCVCGGGVNQHTITSNCLDSSCYGFDCDYWVNANPEYTCLNLETGYGCDCSGCDCPSQAPSVTPSPTPGAVEVNTFAALDDAVHDCSASQRIDIVAASIAVTSTLIVDIAAATSTLAEALSKKAPLSMAAEQSGWFMCGSHASSLNMSG